MGGGIKTKKVSFLARVICYSSPRNFLGKLLGSHSPSKGTQRSIANSHRRDAGKQNGTFLCVHDHTDGYLLRAAGNQPSNSFFLCQPKAKVGRGPSQEDFKVCSLESVVSREKNHPTAIQDARMRQHSVESHISCKMRESGPKDRTGTGRPSDPCADHFFLDTNTAAGQLQPLDSIR